MATAQAHSGVSARGSFEVTRQDRVFGGERPGKRFAIRDDILFECIGIGAGAMYRGDSIVGFNYGKDNGYALLQYFASRALGIHRLPLCEDRIYFDAGVRGRMLQPLLAKLDESRVAAICAEVVEIYKHTQLALAQVGLTEVCLRRELAVKPDAMARSEDYANTLVRLHRSATLLGLEYVDVEMDTLNSFGDEDAYKRDVTLEVTIPVFYCSELIEARDSVQLPVETGEWVIINRSPNGVIRIPTNSISYDHAMFKEDRPFTIDRARAFMESYIPVVVRAPMRAPSNLANWGISPSWLHKALRILNIDIRRAR